MTEKDPDMNASTQMPSRAVEQKGEQEVERDDFVELLKAMVAAAVIALVIRSFLFEPFNIPSGSMFPTLLVGDYLFVEKYSYGYSKYSFPMDMGGFEGRIGERPVTRGDVAVFRQPKKTHIDYIKRIIGLPGDRIQVKEGILYINGDAVTREYLGTEDMQESAATNVYMKYIETLPGGLRHNIYEISDEETLDNTEEFTVPAGYYFAMGDNRDASLDSRVQDQVGFVPAENLIGRAAIIFFSVESIGNVCDRDGTLASLRSFGCKLVEWPKAIRYSRILKRVNVI
jgi:signal peptidase I